jgi:hypothetical protein
MLREPASYGDVSLKKTGKVKKLKTIVNRIKNRGKG